MSESQKKVGTRGRTVKYYKTIKQNVDKEYSKVVSADKKVARAKKARNSAVADKKQKEASDA